MKIVRYFALIALLLGVAPLLAGPTTLPGKSAAPAAGAVAATPAEERAADRRIPHPAPKAGVVQEMAIKELGNFDYDDDKGGNIPADVLALDGSQVKLAGFMIPIDQAGSISRFALVPSLFACCYGQPPQLQHTVVVTCPPGKSVAYYPEQLTVQGTLHVKEKREDGFIISIFEMDASSVKAVGR